eukprot:COSAG01_NODE_1467_length_10217_cov_33.824570_14_plen_149_part_00
MLVGLGATQAAVAAAACAMGRCAGWLALPLPRQQLVMHAADLAAISLFGACSGDGIEGNYRAMCRARRLAGLAVDTEGFRFAGTGLSDASFVPGSVKYGDMPALLALSSPAPLWLGGEETINNVRTRDTVLLCTSEGHTHINIIMNII